MDAIYEKTLLFDFYGELLTERQRDIFREVVFEDCSLGEVAEAHGISRQGVHDMVRRSEKALRGYEEKLGLVGKFLYIRERAERIRTMAEDSEISKLSGEILEVL
ncbi:MAG: YlxM family DNA-binding protein [bacterium]